MDSFRNLSLPSLLSRHQTVCTRSGFSSKRKRLCYCCIVCRSLPQLKVPSIRLSLFTIYVLHPRHILRVESIHVLVHKVKIPTLKGINKDVECDRTTYVCNVRIQLFFLSHVHHRNLERLQMIHSFQNPEKAICKLHNFI